jgi:hypothetical protein
LNGKVRYTGTEKIEKKIYDDIEEKIDSRFSETAEEIRMSVIQEIRDELQPETVPYDRLRLIEKRLHEIATTQDGIVREIVDLKTTLYALEREVDKLKYPKTFETSSPYSSYSMPVVPVSPSYLRSAAPVSPSYIQPAVDNFKSADKTTYIPYDSIRPVKQPPGFSNSTGPSTPIAPIPPIPPISAIPLNAGKKEGWEYQEFVPAKKNIAEPEKFVPAKVIPAKNDPFYFGDEGEEVIDVSPLTNPAPALKQPPNSPSFEKIPFTIQKIPKEKPQDRPDKSEYIIGSNTGPQRAEPEEDYNANCEYIIAEKDSGSRRIGKRFNRAGEEKKERIVSIDDDGTEVITYE